jgi:signal peptide peptidase SppA
MMNDFTMFADRRVWAMEIGALRAYVRLARGLQLDRASLRVLAEERQAVAARPANGRRAAGEIAVIPLLGALTQRGGMSSQGTDDVARAVDEAARDADVSAIVLEVDSPGGEVYGVDEAAAVVRRARAGKPVVAAVNSQACSAAYYIASQATEIIVTPGGEVGSIGVYTAHEDWSRAVDEMGVVVTLVSEGEGKVDGNPYAPLSEEALADMKATVGRYYGMFVAAVSAGRNQPRDRIREEWKARVYGAKDAVRLGMADDVGTLDDAVRRASSLARSRKAVAASVDLEYETRTRARAR